jgi:hypothetical protein
MSGSDIDYQANTRNHEIRASDALLKKLVENHPSHAPVAVLMPKPKAQIENPAPPVAILKADAPSPESAQGPEVGAPPIIPRSPPVIGMAEAVIRAACKHFEIGRETLFSKHKNAVAVRRRFVAIFVARELSTISLLALATKLDLDHSSILHAVRRVTHGMQSEGFAADVNAIRALALKGKAEVARPICPHCLQPVAV